MRRPIARRRITGARGFPHGRDRRAAQARLRAPLALLYRKQGRACPPAPATIRAVDGRAVPLAPRLQIALHLSLTLNEQHHAHHEAAASNGAARAAQTAAHSRSPETANRASAEARAGLLHVRMIRHHSFADAPSNFHAIALSSRGGGGEDANAPETRPGTAPGRLARARPGSQPAGAMARHAQRTEHRVQPTARGGSQAAGAMARHVRRTEHREQPTSVRGGPSDGPKGATLRVNAAGPAGHAFRRPAGPSSPAIPARPNDIVLAQPQRHPVGAAPLYLAGKPAGRSMAPDPFSPAWDPPPLVYRGPVPPPAPAQQPEVRPAAAAQPAAPSVDIEAVSRDVISRIEKRLRVERERRGRS